MNIRLNVFQGTLIFLLMVLSSLSNLSASETDKNLFTPNRVNNLSEGVLIEAANGLNDAVMDIVPLDVNLSVLEKRFFSESN